jgi:recombination protein RecR
MPNLPEPIQNLITAFQRLPGIGPKTASRLTFFLLRGSDDLPEKLSDALRSLRFNITLADRELCEICADSNRDPGTLCVVEEPMDVLMLERTDAFRGRYHVLHGVLSPIEGIGPDDLRLKPLFERVKIGNVKEIILATNPSMEGDATALYIKQQLASVPVRITRLARGLPVGSDLEFADQNTLLRALAGRQEMS